VAVLVTVPSTQVLGHGASSRKSRGACDVITATAETAPTTFDVDVTPAAETVTSPTNRIDQMAVSPSGTSSTALDPDSPEDATSCTE
jgi:hypothetical protein